MEKNFDQLKDLHVANFIGYGDTTDNKIYNKVGTGKVQLTEEEIQDAFLKNRLIVKVGDVFYKPIYVDGEKVAVVTYASSTVGVSVFSAVAAE